MKNKLVFLMFLIVSINIVPGVLAQSQARSTPVWSSNGKRIALYGGDYPKAQVCDVDAGGDLSCQAQGPRAPAESVAAIGEHWDHTLFRARSGGRHQCPSPYRMRNPPSATR
jgi:hypothetical protein